MPDAIPSAVAVFITDEVLGLVAADAEDFGVEDVPLPAWAMTLGSNQGTVMRYLAEADQVGTTGDLRKAALRLAADLVELVEQIDRESGHADRILGTEQPLGADDEPVDAEVIGDDPSGLFDERPFESANPSPAVDHGAVAAAVAKQSDVTYWNGERWRSYLRNVGVRVADTLRSAQRLARELGVAEPGTLEDIQEPRLAAALRAWVDEHATAVPA